MDGTAIVGGALPLRARVAGPLSLTRFAFAWPEESIPCIYTSPSIISSSPSLPIHGPQYPLPRPSSPPAPPARSGTVHSLWPSSLSNAHKGLVLPTQSVQNQIHELAKSLPPPRKQNTACDACRCFRPPPFDASFNLTVHQVQES